MDKLLKIKKRKEKLEILVKCEMCNNEKKLLYFAKLKKYYKRKICQECYPLFLKDQKNKWCENKRLTNINYRLKKSIAARLRSVLVKEESTMNYIGCNIQYLREWFDYNFTDEMSWDNYGSYWQIDHIIPVAKFDLTNEDEKFACWNWTNLMPVTISYNSSKKNKIDFNQIEYVISKLEKFKEEGSTTKWFSEKFMITKELAIKKNI
jgi:hypothetical protein